MASKFQYQMAKKSNLEMDIFCHFRFCHNRTTDICKDILADSILFYIASYFARKNGPPLCI